MRVNPKACIEHLFWYWDRIFPLWNALAHWIRSVTEKEFSLESVLLGYTNCKPCKNAINSIILVVKFFIYKCKIMEGRNPDFAGIQSYLKDGAYYCYCAYVLRISRYSDFLSPMLTNTGIFFRGLKLSGESLSW